ncbi:tail fiber protein [Sphingomonas sp. ZT3P38]|uniref:phage tail protein n=1 Tax=Parasphingomonas zepuensis TaxID=3096161 RepID=UPI002FCAD3E2
MSNPFLGEIRMFAGVFAPRGFAFCNGQTIAIAENDALYTLIGTTYGGDGVTTFGLPDLRGRVPINQGQGPGLSSYVIGQKAGTESVTLTLLQTPSHSHTLSATSANGNVAVPNNQTLPAAPDAATPHTTASLYVEATPNTVVQNAMDPTSISPSGGGNQPHENRMPLLAFSFIIALEGVFPSRN